jgi:hypothetical protein
MFFNSYDFPEQFAISVRAHKGWKVLVDNEIVLGI